MYAFRCQALMRTLLMLFLMNVLVLPGNARSELVDASGTVSTKKSYQPGEERVITGQVSDEQGPLIGVNVLIKGTTIGCITDFDGNFSLTTTEENPVVVFSYIGYKTQEVVARGNAPLQVVLVSDTQVMDEVVVTALVSNVLPRH